MKKLLVLLAVVVALVLGGAAYLKLTQKPVPVASTPPPSVAPLTFQDQVAIANVACGQPTKLDDKKNISCPVCPKGADFSGENASPGLGDGWTADGVLGGHFTAAGADEAILHASGCESHARNYGGDFLLRRTGGQWSVIRYAGGGTANDKCLKLPWQSGRDAVICQTSDMHQGVASDALQFLLFDAAAPANEDWKNTHFLITSDESANCGFIPSELGTLQIGKIDGIQILPPDATGKQDVSVSASIAQFPAPAQGKSCPNITPTSYKVHFKNMGDHFQATDGYQPLADLAKASGDCCELTITETVRPGKY